MFDSISRFHFVRVDVGYDFPNLFHIRQHLDSEALLKQFFCDGTGGHAADCFAGAGASAALPVSEAKFLLVGEIGV